MRKGFSFRFNHQITRTKKKESFLNRTPWKLVISLHLKDMHKNTESMPSDWKKIYMTLTNDKSFHHAHM